MKSSKPLALAALLIATSLAPHHGWAAAAADSKGKKKSKTQTEQTSEQGGTEYVHFAQWKEVSEFIDQMVQTHGFDRDKLAAIFDNTRYVESAIKLIKPAPTGRPKNWKAYRARFVEPKRIEAGIAFWDQYADALTRAENQYGVPAEIIVGLIGVESIFGRMTGGFRVMDTLTTLAFAYPDTPTRAARMDFFRSELENFLLLSRESDADPFSFKGSYAGAIGLPQFMPGSIRKFAVDFDGDGKIDLLGSPVDAIGSVANYLALHGWKKSLPTVFPATLTIPEADAVGGAVARFQTQGLKAAYTLDELKAIASTAGDAPGNLSYGLVDLQNGDEATEYWFATDNFYAITQYNRSFFYAMSVIDLGRVIGAARGK
ncbi:lytic murein transglycosylase B [Undibacterium sp.]|uniref:lytic murein transglycosylase B n=1 Tax=Undibacterium sp. TaxID=1914977 RepID=UPI002C3A9FE8|nr:lytic murein transglycosylase B [Undibacterium sp.]HTD04255.1 lytic murein transglycosylase B [Undibacterium sp.]